MFPANCVRLELFDGIFVQKSAEFDDIYDYNTRIRDRDRENSGAIQDIQVGMKSYWALAEPMSTIAPALAGRTLVKACKSAQLRGIITRCRDSSCSVQVKKDRVGVVELNMHPLYHVSISKALFEEWNNTKTGDFILFD